MMISPEQFAEDLADLSYEQLVVEKNRLIGEIATFEKAAESGGPDGGGIDPSPEVVYQCNLRYLAKVCELVADRYNAEVVRENETPFSS